NRAGAAGQGGAAAGEGAAWLVTGAGLGDAPGPGGLAAGVSRPQPASAAVAAAAAPSRAARPGAGGSITAGEPPGFPRRAGGAFNLGSGPGRAGEVDADNRGEPLQALLQPGDLRVARLAHLVPDVVGHVDLERVPRDWLRLRRGQVRAGGTHLHHLRDGGVRL